MEQLIDFMRAANFNDFILLFFRLKGAHMRRASAELAERRRASFGSRGDVELIIFA